MRNEISILREKIALENGSSHHQLKDSLGDIIKVTLLDQLNVHVHNYTYMYIYIIITI